jgi:hypothetical protein
VDEFGELRLDISTITNPQDLAELTEGELLDAAQQCAALMAVAQTEMNLNAPAHHAFLAAKERYVGYRQIGTILQTILRVVR